MSGLAAVLLKRGFPVSGSDSKESPLTDWLTGMGATIHYPQSESDKRMFWITLDNYREFQRNCPYYEFQIEAIYDTRVKNKNMIVNVISDKLTGIIK